MYAYVALLARKLSQKNVQIHTSTSEPPKSLQHLPTDAEKGHVHNAFFFVKQPT